MLECKRAEPSPNCNRKRKEKVGIGSALVALVGWPEVSPDRADRGKSVQIRAVAGFGLKPAGFRPTIGTRTEMRGLVPAGPVREDLWPTYQLASRAVWGRRPWSQMG